MPKIKIEQIYEDFQEACKHQNKLLKEIKKDNEFALGKQWKAEDVETLRIAGVQALTINKMRPMIKLLSGIERQGRTDYVAFAEGDEDSLVSEIVTRLLKNIGKGPRIDKKLSEVFKEGITSGLCFIEPYIDYTFDLINGEMKIRKLNANSIYIDPNGEEYDLSDRRYVIKFIRNLSMDQLLEIFPKSSEEDFSSLKIRKADPNMILTPASQLKAGGDGYPTVTDEDFDTEMREPQGFDMLEYYYKKMVRKYFVANRSDGSIQEFDDKKEAEKIIEESQDSQGSLVLISKNTPDIRLVQVVGDKIMSDEVSWSFPRWKTFPIFPFYAERMTLNDVNFDLTIQGVVRSLRDLQEEFNKRRTQELRHLNSSVNSGMFVPRGALDPRNAEKLKNFGASPGVNIVWDPSQSGGTVPQQWRMLPSPLSQGHSQLAVENSQDIKEASGVNPDLLANESQSQSGRAIALKQRQGLVMVQEALDNFSETKVTLGKFLLSQLGELYTVDTVIRVLGPGFLERNFRKPVLDQRGDPILGEDGEIQTELSIEEAAVTINQILNDSALGKYDVSIGEGAYNETIKMANFATLLDMQAQGAPIPPEIMLDESMLSEGQKKKIKEAFNAARKSQQEAETVAKNQGG